MRKKRGSSLVSVVIILGVLITVGTAMVSMTVGDYKLRMTESTRIKNLYSSESGLDVAYDILVKTFDAAAVYGIQKTDKYKKTTDITYIDDKISSIRGDNSIQNKDEQIKSLEARKNQMIDNYFKTVFYTFIDSQNSQDDGTPNNENEIRKSIRDKKYIVIDSNGNERYVPVIINTDNTRAMELFVGGQTADDSEGIKSEEVPANPSNGKEYPSRNYAIKITSKYNTGNTERKLQSTYTVLVPNYKDVYFSESNANLQINPIIADKVLAIDGSMRVNSSTNGKLEVWGNIFAWGNNSDNQDYSVAYNKYKGGINIKNSTANFKGEVVTGKTFNIEDNVNSTITGNLYAMNVYAGKINGDTSVSSNLTVKEFGEEDRNKDYNKDVNESGQVVTDNDLTLKANNSTIEIGSFYGINDKNTKYGDNFNSSTLGKDRTSSSIIVNGDLNSSIKINNKAYIMGVAHIATTPKEYQTGESTGVKGNYIAYASDIKDTDKTGYYSPFQLLDDDNILIKSKHFVDYWSDKLEDKNTGGIELPDKTYSIGAIVYKDTKQQLQIKDSSYTLKNQSDMDMENVIPKKRFEYALKVYNMGRIPIIRGYDTLGQGIENPVSELMTLNDTTLNGYNIYKEDSNAEKAILNSDSGTTIKIKKGINPKDSQKHIDVDNDNKNILIYTEDGNIKAFVATNGNVVIDGGINFRGNIIAKGDLDIIGSGDKTITYDKDLCNRIQAQRVDIFNSIFGNILKETKVSTDSLSVDYDLNKFIKNGVWKIIK